MLDLFIAFIGGIIIGAILSKNIRNDLDYLKMIDAANDENRRLLEVQKKLVEKNSELQSLLNKSSKWV